MPNIKSQTPLYDPSVPEELKHTLLWFGSIIERPMGVEHRMTLTSPSGNSMEEEAQRYISPSPTLASHERIEIYNQQYWWRLLGILHEVYPFVTRLFGYTEFNQRLGFPYICRYRPEHWSLSFLGSQLPTFLKETYWEKDRDLVIDAATLDDAFNEAFFVQQMPPIKLPVRADKKAAAALLNSKFYLQRHVQLFNFPYHLLKFRAEFIEPEDGDHWLERPFPPMENGNRHYFILFRNLRNLIEWRLITAGEYHLLRLFKKGHSASDACTWLEKQDGPFVEEAATHLHTWFQEWVLQGLLTTEKPPTKRECFPPEIF